MGPYQIDVTQDKKGTFSTVKISSNFSFNYQHASFSLPLQAFYVRKASSGLERKWHLFLGLII